MPEYEDEIINVWNGTKFTPALCKCHGHDQKVFEVWFSNGLLV
jgi:hypothetical protein